MVYRVNHVITFQYIFTNRWRYRKCMKDNHTYLMISLEYHPENFVKSFFFFIFNKKRYGKKLFGCNATSYHIGL